MSQSHLVRCHLGMTASRARLRGGRRAPPRLAILLIAAAGCHYAGYEPTEPALPVYTVQQLGLLAGGTQSQAMSGSATTIVGWATDAGGVAHAVVFAGGAATRLGEPSGALNSQAEAVNGIGAIVGFATLAGGVRQGLVWSSASSAPTPLPSLGGAYSSAASINDQNVILGTAQTDTGDTVLVLWQPSGASYAVARVDTAGGVDDLPAAINDSGQLAGTLGGGQGAFFWDPSTGVDTITPPTGTVAQGLSGLGIEVGGIYGASPARAWVFTTTIGLVVMGAPPTGYTDVVANSISNQGIIAGTASTVSGGTTQTSEVVIGTVVSPSSAFASLPSLGGSLAQAAGNGTTTCGVIVGWGTLQGSALHRAAAWIPKGCTVP
jgi:hypothetical protein